MDRKGGTYGSAYKHALKLLIIKFVSFGVSILSGGSSDTVLVFSLSTNLKIIATQWISIQLHIQFLMP